MSNIALKSVDFVLPDGKPIPGLIRLQDSKTREKLSVDEHAAMLDADFLEGIDYVYFRRFSDGRSSQVAAYVVDNSNNKLDRNGLAELHRQVWLQGRAPLLYISWATCIDILACARGPDFWNERLGDYQYKPAKSFELDLLTTAADISDEMKKFSAFRLADGTFWEDPCNSALAKHEKAAHQSLIQAVVDADTDLDGENEPVLRRLLLIMVLVKHLEDRDVFPQNGGWFGRFHAGAKNFFDVLKGGEPEEVNRLLKFLEKRFNGDVFDLSHLSGRKLSKTSLKRFAQLVEARTIKRQRYLWEQFSFRHLPVEIISHLYQRFIEDGHGAVYTPPFLAGLLLDHAMPYNKLNGKERILDPACGSGVFLVGAFRRLVNFWRSKNDWKRPSVNKLKEILRDRIFGVDLEGDAIDLTAFSLALGVCDSLKPEVIWNELKFDPLRDRNLIEKDFFELLQESRNGSSTILEKPFDVVIGNPPFESKLTEDGMEIERQEQKNDHERGKCPDNQVAYLFLEQSLSILCPKGGQFCLIQPAGFLHNNNVDAFRSSLFRKSHVDDILDFVSIRKLYSADVKTVAVCGHAGKLTVDHWTNHWVFRRTFSVKERIGFELDHYDQFRVSQKDAESDSYIWRTNLLGGGRLLEMSRRLRNMRTLSKYIDEQDSDWDYGEGFIAAKTGRREPATFLTGKPFLPTRAFTHAGIDETKIETVTETHFRSAYTVERYSPPLILIKENDSLPVAFWDKGFLAYRHEIVGIHAPKRDKSELQKLHRFLVKRHSFFRFIVMLHGSRSLVGKSTAILKRDIDLLPYPEDESELSFCFWEEALCDDILNHLTEYVRLGQNSHLLKVAAEKKDLHEYSAMFVRMLGSVYDNLQASEPIFLNGLTCQPFYFGDHPKVDWLDRGSEDKLRKLIYYENNDQLRTVRILRLYFENVMLIVKPDRLRYWIRSTAIRDADETLVDLKEQGY